MCLFYTVPSGHTSTNCSLTSLEADVLRSTGHPGELGDENHPTGMVVQGHQVVHGAVPEQKDKLTKMHPHFCVYVDDLIVVQSLA